MKAVALTAALGVLARAAAAADACNGYSELCGRAYSEVAYATTHNSYAVGDNIAANQNKNIRQQLDDGVRGFMLDLHKLDSGSSAEPYLCHTSCTLLNAGKLVDALGDFRTYLAANPREVVTIYIENAQPFGAADIAKAFTDARLDAYAYAPSGGNTTWPTLGSMISSGKRLVVFSDRGADASVAPWILDENSHSVQTSYTVAEGRSFDCQPLRAVRPLWVMNHFVYTNLTLGIANFDRPAPDAAASVNTESSIESQAALCQSAGHRPNFVTVDYYDVGEVFRAVAGINKVAYKPTATNTFGSGDAGRTATSRSAAPLSVASACALLLPLLVAAV
ncbi:hypothetical protein IWQ56_002165 [Coemansia nantahalensis]|uniref:Uncharacterized protein n=1 Tax=Coemansia nantahalensis TaxID=2789366 RepID=A0ACC1JL27_9FUNG|nr:hypothetical protein IWQ57_005966 [Coemansia nantahalensis]KAJ2770440.1 hypothetical protein IWQ56_002165 [Coemansia nantahalensis]